jgi:transposase
VIVESSSEAFAIADAALEMGHEVRVVPATLVRTLGVGARRVKNDRRDSQVLSEVSCRIDLPSVHIPTQESRRRKALCGMREALVSARTQLVNTVRGWLRTQGQRVRSGSVETFTARVQRHYGATKARTVPRFVERQMEAIDQLSEQIDEADAELSSIAERDEVCRRLMSVPGVGPVTSVRFVAALDDTARFENAHRVESYLGLTPGEDSSSDRKRLTSITKAGPARMRWALVQACWSARRWRKNDPMVVWSYQVEQRRGKRVAVVALARKLAGVLYAIWRDGSIYDPKHRAEVSSEAVAG